MAPSIIFTFHVITYHVRLLTNGLTQLTRDDGGYMDRPMVMDIEYQDQVNRAMCIDHYHRKCRSACPR